MMHSFTPASLLLVILISIVTPSQCVSSSGGLLTVHLIPHSHDDVGYEKTLDQYYYGTNQTIRAAAVQYTLDSIIPSLLADSSRRFIQVEIAFFERWWKEQSPKMQSNVRSLISNGQFEFVNGGYVMHDEACTHAIDMIDQMTLGHKFLLDTFGVTPTTAWQIDPFGHSATQAGLLGAYAGFDSLYMCRIDYEDKFARMFSKNLELIWDASPSLGTKAALFTSITVAHYGSPPFFCFDSICDNGADDPVEDDPSMEDSNVNVKVDLWIGEIAAEAQAFQGNEIMIMLGGDFQWNNAQRNFKEYEKLINYANTKMQGKMLFKFSTPSAYTAAKLQDPSISLSRKQDDFFPYADAPHQYWVGFFTSRPALKRNVRVCSAFLQTARQLAVWSGEPDSTGALWEAQAIAQHHDAVSGTSMQHVAYDYALRLAKGWTAAQAGSVANGLAQVVTPNGSVLPFLVGCTQRNESICLPSQSVSPQAPTLLILVYNPLAHARTELVALPVNQQGIIVLDHNAQPIQSSVVPLSDAQRRAASPITRRNPPPNFEVGSDEPIDLTEEEEAHSTFLDTAPYTIYFQATLPPMGVSTFFLQNTQQDMREYDKMDVEPEFTQEDEPPKKSKRPLVSTSASSAAPIDSLLTMSNSLIMLSFSSATGLLLGYTDQTNPSVGWQNYTLQQQFLYYTSFFDPTGKQENAGAYVSRFENNNQPTYISSTSPSTPTATLTFGIQGPLIWEAHQVFSDWVSQTVRLTAGSTEVEFIWTIGPVPLEDSDGSQSGKEIISRFVTDSSISQGSFTGTEIQNGGLWYTDSNGREMQLRERDLRATWNVSHEEPVAMNYYPVNTLAYMNDAATSPSGTPTARLTILVDRSQGCSSISNTSMEFMLHRRLIGDDNKGVHEPLNETESITPYPNPQRIGPGITITGTHRLLLQPIATLPSGASFASQFRSAQSRMYFPLEIQLSPLSEGAASYLQTHSGNLTFTTELLEQLELLTFMPWENNTILLRVGHSFSISDDPVLGQPVSFDLATIFPSSTIQSVQEWSLTANRRMEEFSKDRMDYAKRLNHLAKEPVEPEELVFKSSMKKHPKRYGRRRNKKEVQQFVVTIAPMEVRTFQIILQ